MEEIMDMMSVHDAYFIGLNLHLMTLHMQCSQLLIIYESGGQCRTKMKKASLKIKT